MTVALFHDPAQIDGSGSALMERFLRQSRAADLCEAIAGLRARQHALNGLTDLTPDEEAAYGDIETRLSDARAELTAMVQAQLGVSFDQLREAGL